MKAGVKTYIHNRFDIYRTNIETGKTEQIAYAENIVLNQMWSQLTARAAYFGNIHFGTGSGTLSAARTTLFTYLGTKAAVDDVLTRTIPTASWRRKIVLNPEDNIGAVLTEVGISYDSGASHLVTHALLKDMNGNSVSITKTAYDVLTIYATVYITFSMSDANLKMCGLPNTNPLMNYLVGGAAFPSCYFFTGESPQDTQESTLSILGRYALGTSAEVTWTADITNKKITSSTPRFAVGDSNGDIAEIGFGSALATPIFRYTFPSAIYSGLVLTDVPLGSGNATRKKFRLPSRNIDQSTVVVKMDGTTVTNYTKAIEGDSASVLNINQIGGFRQTDPTTSYIRWARNVLSVVVIESGWVDVFDYSKITNTFTARTTPVISGARSVSLSGDGLVLAVTLAGSPYVKTYDWSGTAWLIRADPAVLPTGDSYGCMLSTDGLVLAVTHATSPYVTVYDWTAGAWVKRANPANLPTGTGADVFISGNALFMAVAHATTPFITSYDLIAGAWVKRADPATLPASACTKVSVTEDGLVMAVRHVTTPYVSVYDWVINVWVKRADPTTLTAATSVKLFSKGNGMAVTRGDISVLSVYLWDGLSWNKQTDVTVGSHGNDAGYELDISYDEEILLCGKYSYWGNISLAPFGCKGYSTMLEFDASPANGAVLTASYTVKGIHKTIQRVIDLTAVITFGEPV